MSTLVQQRRYLHPPASWKQQSAAMDSTRSWVVAAGCCWINAFSCAVFRSSAVLFVNIIESLGVTREEASWPITLMGICSSLSAPLAGILAKHIAIWKLTVCATLLASISLAVCFFGNTTPFLIVFLGILHGTCLGFVYLFNTVLSQHFSRYRALASGIASSGYTIGGLVFPPVIQVIFETYGFNGGFLLCGAVTLHSTAGALLFRLPPGVNKRISNVVDRGPPKNSDIHEGTTDNLELVSLCNATSDNLASDEGDSARREKDEQDFEQHTQERRGSSDHRQTKLERFDNESTKRNVILYTMIKTIQTISLPSFFRLPRFYLIAFSFAQVMFNMSTYFTVIVDFATDREVSKWNAILLLVFYGMADLASRFGSGWITDKQHISRTAMMSLGFFLWAASFFVLGSTRLYPILIGCSIVAGWTNGATSALVPVLVMELVDGQEFSLCFGFVILIVALPFCIRPAMIGLFRDKIGDYQGMFFVLAACMTLTALLWMWVFVQDRWRERKSQKSNGNGNKAVRRHHQK